MRFFFNAELGDNGFHGYLDAASVYRYSNQMGIFNAPFSTRKDKTGMAVNVPEFFKNM